MPERRLIRESTESFSRNRPSSLGLTDSGREWLHLRDGPPSGSATGGKASRRLPAAGFGLRNRAPLGQKGSSCFLPSDHRVRKQGVYGEFRPVSVGAILSLQREPIPDSCVRTDTTTLRVLAEGVNEASSEVRHLKLSSEAERADLLPTFEPDAGRARAGRRFALLQDENEDSLAVLIGEFQKGLRRSIQLHETHFRMGETSHRDRQLPKKPILTGFIRCRI